MLRFWLIRHGESEWNAAGKLQGQADSPLNAAGRAQAAQVARYFADIGLTALYTSPLLRAQETADIIGAALGLRPVSDARLVEYGVGEAAGLDWDGIFARWPHLEAPASRSEFILPQVPGAEPLSNLVTRVMASLNEIRMAHPAGGDVGIVSHGGVFRAYLGQLMGVPNGLFVGLRFSNASLSRVTLREAGWVSVDFVNRTCHLGKPADQAQATHLFV